MSKTKYRFEVVYCPDYMQRAINLIRSLDIDMDGAGFLHTMEFSSSKDLSIEELKRHITNAYESDKCKVMSIQGGKIE